MSRLGLVTYVAREYDEAIGFFVGKLDFELVEDTDMGEGKQAGGRVAFFLNTDNIDRDYANWSARGVKFRQQPRHEVYGTVAVFEDLYGAPWDLIQPA